MTGKEASEYLLRVHSIRRTADTLKVMRVKGGGPRFCKDGRAVIYDAGDLDAWARARKSAPVASTSELSEGRWAD
jgi:hypothetical protein